MHASKGLESREKRQVGESELSLFLNLNARANNEEIPKKYSEVPNTV